MKGIYLISVAVLFVATIILALYFNFYTKIQNGQNIGLIFEEGIKILSPKENETISSPLTIEGYVNGGGWIGFEGQVGTVSLRDSKGKELAFGVLNAKGEWMQKKIDFETKLSFVSIAEQTGSLFFQNENPSGEEVMNKTFSYPIRLQTMETMPVSVFFHKIGQDECQEVTEVARNIQKTQAPARAALEELLVGPYIKENTQYMTSINPGVKIQSLTVENGVAKVDFDSRLEQNVAGSCRVIGIRSQIENTLKQFPTIKSVLISINGRTEDILQP